MHEEVLFSTTMWSRVQCGKMQCGKMQCGGRPVSQNAQIVLLGDGRAEVYFYVDSLCEDKVEELLIFSGKEICLVKTECPRGVVLATSCSCVVWVKISAGVCILCGRLDVVKSRGRYNG